MTDCYDFNQANAFPHAQPIYDAKLSLRRFNGVEVNQVCLVLVSKRVLALCSSEKRNDSVHHVFPLRCYNVLDQPAYDFFGEDNFNLPLQ